uniref:Uncharacterized protein n=1 Tax=Rhizophora mucronata TaxID=61149 RepID=A0A2P2PPY7_RHIMU
MKQVSQLPFFPFSFLKSQIIKYQVQQIRQRWHF